MTCRHRDGDPSCSSHPDNVARARRVVEEEEAREMSSRTPNADKYQIMDAVRVGPHLVLNVQYPNCSKCSFEGNKILVFLNTPETSVLKWRRIDPHFSDPDEKRLDHQAPSPAARFPASETGWRDAIEYATRKWEAQSGR